MNVVVRCLVFIACSMLTANQHALASAGTGTTTAPMCLRASAKKCVIISLSQSDPSHEVTLPVLSGKSALQIKRGNLIAFSEQLANQLATVEMLQLGQLNLKKIFLKPQLLELTATGNQIDTVEFPAKVHLFKLQLLDLSANRLNHLNGFDVLVNLRELHLEDNALDSVNLQVFKDMTVLEKLFLDRNQITTVTAPESFELPALEYLSLSGNHIGKLDVINWQLDSLTKLDVSKNRMINIDGNPEERFPSLQLVSVARNEWHCKWLEETLQRFNDSKVVVQDRDEDCQGISPANICCVPDHDTDSANDQQLNDLKLLERTQKDRLVNFEASFGKLKIDNESKLKSLESRLKKVEELQKTKKEDPDSGGDSNPIFESLGQVVKRIESSLKQEQQLWAKQRKEVDAVQRKLAYTILELSRSLERDTKQIAELQVQLKDLQNLVRDTQMNREMLKV